MAQSDTISLASSVMSYSSSYRTMRWFRKIKSAKGSISSKVPSELASMTCTTWIRFNRWVSAASSQFPGHTLPVEAQGTHDAQTGDEEDDITL